MSLDVYGYIFCGSSLDSVLILVSICAKVGKGTPWGTGGYEM